MAIWLLAVSLLGVEPQLIPPALPYRDAVAMAQKEQKPLMILFSAAWCPSCQTMKNSVMPQLEKEGWYTFVAFTVVDVDKQAELTRAFITVKALRPRAPIPQLVLFYRTSAGWRFKKLVGAQSLATVKVFILEGAAIQQAAKHPQ